MRQFEFLTLAIKMSFLFDFCTDVLLTIAGDQFRIFLASILFAYASTSVWLVTMSCSKEKSIKIAIDFYSKTTSRSFVVIDYSFCQAARVVSEKTSFSCCTTHICKGLIEILSQPWSIKIVTIEVAGFKSYIPTRTCSKTQFQMLIEIPFRLL